MPLVLYSIDDQGHVCPVKAPIITLQDLGVLCMPVEKKPASHGLTINPREEFPQTGPE